jgi:NAD(P)-dependent dehydrogenase (short-subunit alcohol dehydrogenase family)
MSERFAGKHVLVTGGSAGIGLAIAAAFLAEGAALTLSARNRARLEDAVDGLGAGAAAIAIACDVSDADSVATLASESRAALGPVDVLVNNAGTVTMAECAEMTEGEWDEVMDVNAKGPFLCARALLPDLRERQGSIVNISSQAGKLGYPRLTHYCASKAALLGFTRALAVEAAPEVRVNAICPGIVETEMMEREYGWIGELTDSPREQIKRRFLDAIPLGRFQRPDDIARTTLFLASAEADAITGAAVNVTGGGMTD